MDELGLRRGQKGMNEWNMNETIEGKETKLYLIRREKECK